MRAKFVPAELLYPSATQPTSLESPHLQSNSHGAADYSSFNHNGKNGQEMQYNSYANSVFAQPQVSVAAAAFSSQEPVVKEAVLQQTSSYDSDFQIPGFDPSQLAEDIDSEPFLNSFTYKANGAKPKEPKSVPSSMTKDSHSEPEGKREVSKFGFGYEALSENIDGLELTTNTKDLVEKFSQAKYQIEMGNVDEGEQILTSMMGNNQIRFKEFVGLDDHIMNQFNQDSE